MYVPPHFRQDDRETTFAFVEASRLATLVTAGAGGPRASHLPMLFDRGGGSNGTLLAHVARANEQWRDLETGCEALVIFLGPDGYVSPTAYTGHAGGKVVPTWNYVAVHAYGTARTIHDPAELHAVVDRLTEAHERGRDDAWRVDEAPDAFVAGQLRGIVGIEISVTRFDAKWKMSQNRSDADRAGVIADLRDSPLEAERLTARIMQEMPRRGEPPV